MVDTYVHLLLQRNSQFRRWQMQVINRWLNFIQVLDFVFTFWRIKLHVIKVLNVMGDGYMAGQQVSLCLSVVLCCYIGMYLYLSNFLVFYYFVGIWEWSRTERFTWLFRFTMGKDVQRIANIFNIHIKNYIWKIGNNFVF